MEATISFKAFWISTISPAITGDFDRLLNTVPKRIAARKQRKKEKRARLRAARAPLIGVESLARRDGLLGTTAPGSGRLGGLQPELLP